jgi:hypothetical protein
MKKVILGLVAFASIAATAATARLGSANLEADDTSVTIDVRKGAPVVGEIVLAAKGEAVRIGEVTVVFRTGNGNGPYEAAKFRVNRVLANGGALALDIPDNGLAVRRIEIEASQAGFGRDTSITAYGN